MLRKQRTCSGSAGTCSGTTRSCSGTTGAVDYLRVTDRETRCWLGLVAKGVSGLTTICRHCSPPFSHYDVVWLEGLEKEVYLMFVLTAEFGINTGYGPAGAIGELQSDGPR